MLLLDKIIRIIPLCGGTVVTISFNLFPWIPAAAKPWMTAILLAIGVVWSVAWVTRDTVRESKAMRSRIAELEEKILGLERSNARQKKDVSVKDSEALGYRSALMAFGSCLYMLKVSNPKDETGFLHSHNKCWQ